MRSVVLLLLFISFVNIAYAESVFEELPLGIVIGQTHNNEIKTRGTCLKRIKAADDTFRCEQYNMAGQFTVHSSEDEIVIELMFAGEEENELPGTWQNLGLALSTDNNRGTPFDEFMSIIDSEQVTHVAAKEENHHHLVTFKAGNLHYTVHIWKHDNYHPARMKGIGSISVTAL